MTLINVQNLLIKNKNEEILNGTLTKTKLIKILNIWYMFADELVDLFNKIFGHFLLLTLIHNCEVISISFLYTFVISFTHDIHFGSSLFFLHFAVAPIVIIFYLVHGLEGLSFQVI